MAALDLKEGSMAAPTARFPCSGSQATHSQRPRGSYCHLQSKRRAAQLQAFAWAVPRPGAPFLVLRTRLPSRKVAHTKPPGPICSRG